MLRIAIEPPSSLVSPAEHWAARFLSKYKWSREHELMQIEYVNWLFLTSDQRKRAYPTVERGC